MTETLTFVLHRDGRRGWWTEVLECPGCFSSGVDVADALECAAEAFELWNNDSLFVEKRLVALASATAASHPPTQGRKGDL